MASTLTCDKNLTSNVARNFEISKTEAKNTWKAVAKSFNTSTNFH